MAGASVEPYALDGDSLHLAVRFEGAREVRFAASFTGWQPLPMSFRQDGRFALTLPAPPAGLHLYKYVVDGLWTPDPAHTDRRPDGHGGSNSVLLTGLGGAGALRVASLNLHCWQEERAHDKLAEIARVFASLDVHAAALQEVGQPPNAGELLRGLLEQQTGVPWSHRWAFAHIGFDIYQEGVSLLSRLPLEDPREHELGGKTWRRVALSARIGSLRLCTAHTSWPADGGGEEIEALLSSLGPGPALVAGDLNAEPDSAPIASLRAAGFEDVGRGTGRTFLGSASRLDYQLLRPGDERWRAVAWASLFDSQPVFGVPQPYVSDHIGLLGAYRNSRSPT